MPTKALYGPERYLRDHTRFAAMLPGSTWMIDNCPLSKCDAVRAVAYWHRSKSEPACIQLLYEIKDKRAHLAPLLDLPSKSEFE